MARSKLNIKFRLQFSAQKDGRNAPAALAKQISDYGTLLFNDIVIRAADYEKAEVVARLVGRVEVVVRQEIDRLARYMFAGIVGRPDGAIGPTGNLNISEAGQGIPSNVQSTIGVRYAAWNVADAGISWTPRSEKYLRRKLREKGQVEWFNYDGVLGSFLKNPEELLATFGPIDVSFIEANSGRAVPEDSLVSPAPNVGRPGLDTLHKRLRLGTIAVSVFGRIKPSMLGNLENIPEGDTSGLIGLLPSGVAYRLDGGPRHPYRMTIEPYLTYFLTRGIPIAVLRRLSADFKSRADGHGSG